MMLDAPWLTQAATRAVIAALEAARPGGSRFVGGCVRNTLLDAPVDDLDIATQLRPEETIAAAKAAGLVAVPTGIEHGTITVIADHIPFEVTTLRRDVSTDGRRATVAFTEDWAEDARRRDFRMNALYAAPDGHVFDPTGGGLDDIRDGRVIFIGDADARIREDYLRILRFFRFSAWYGRGALDAAGLAACAALRGGLTQLSAERVWKESKKLLAAPDPRDALQAMEKAGVCAALWPEAQNLARLLKLVDVEIAEALAPEPLRRLAGALDNPHEARALARRLKLSNDERADLVAASEALSILSDKDARALIYRVGARAFRDRLLIAWAEAPNPAYRALLALAAAWTPPRLPIGGEDVIAAGAPAGPRVGQVLRALEDWWIEGDFTADRAALDARLREVLQTPG